MSDADKDLTASDVDADTVTKAKAKATATSPSRAQVAYWLVLLGVFIGLVWKWNFFVTCDRTYTEMPIMDSFFPAWLRDQRVLRWTYLGSLGAILIAGIVPHARMRQIACWTLLAATSVMCVHQGSYNDVTFMTTWWTVLWTVWFVHHLQDTSADAVLRRATFLSRAIIALILLGGAAGKWTAEYWSGEVFYDIYFVDRNFWIFSWLRSTFEEASLRELATVYSRIVILIETICGLGLWLLPPRVAAIIGIVVLTSITLFSNFSLISVLACLIALSAVGLFVRPVQTTE